MIFVFTAILGLSFAASVGAVENACTCEAGLGTSKMFCSLDGPDDHFPITEDQCNGRIIKEVNLHLLRHSSLTSNLVPKFRLDTLSFSGEHLKEVSHDAFDGHEDFLYFLDISNAAFVEIPTAALKNLGSLITLNMATNIITSVNCSIENRYLGELILSNNRISNIDSCAFPLYLDTLELSNNLITTLNGSLKNHPQLQRVYVNHNKLTTLEGQLERLRQLYWLEASWNKIEVITLTSVKLYNLDHLDLSHNHISELGKNMTQFIYLSFLDLSYNYIERLDNDVFADLKHLVYLGLSANHIRYIENEAFFHQRRLQELLISHNAIANLDGKINYLISLKKLDASWNYLKRFEMAVLHLTSLEDMNLSQNRITSFGKKEYANQLDCLKKFDISYNNLRLIRTDSFYRFPNIQELNLSGNQIRVLKGSQFISLKGLRGLDLSYTGLLTLELLTVPGFMKMELGTDNHWVDKKSALEGWIDEKCVCRSKDVMHTLKIEGNVMACFINHTVISAIMDRSNIKVIGCEEG